MAWGYFASRRRAADDLGTETGDLLLRAGEASARDLAACRRSHRTLEGDYQRLALWALDVRGKLARRAPDEPVEPMPTRSANGDTPTAFPMTDRDEVRLRRLLVKYMQANDLKTLAFDLGVDEMQGTTPGEMARSLLDYVRKHHQSPQLLKWLVENRPDIKITEDA